MTDDVRAAVTGEWLEAVIPGFSLNAGGQMGGVLGPTWRVTAVRRDGVWCLNVSTDEGDGGLPCPTRGHVRRLFAAMGLPLANDMPPADPLARWAGRPNHTLVRLGDVRRAVGTNQGG